MKFNKQPQFCKKVEEPLPARRPTTRKEPRVERAEPHERFEPELDLPGTLAVTKLLQASTCVSYLCLTSRFKNNRWISVVLEICLNKLLKIYLKWLSTTCVTYLYEETAQSEVLKLRFKLVLRKMSVKSEVFCFRPIYLQIMRCQHSNGSLYPDSCQTCRWKRGNL